jgi:hypothetical protein
MNNKMTPQDFMGFLSGLGSDVKATLHADNDPDYPNDDPGAFGTAHRDFTQVTEDNIVNYLNKIAAKLDATEDSAFRQFGSRVQAAIPEVLQVYDTVRLDDSSYATTFQTYAQNIADDKKKVDELTALFSA